MKNTQRRAYVLNDCKSPYIAQAIFILRDEVSDNENGILADAERIVAAYMGAPAPVRRTKRKKLPTAAVSALTLVIAVAAFAALRLLFRQ